MKLLPLLITHFNLIYHLLIIAADDDDLFENLDTQPVKPVFLDLFTLPQTKQSNKNANFSLEVSHSANFSLEASHSDTTAKVKEVNDNDLTDETLEKKILSTEMQRLRNKSRQYIASAKQQPQPQQHLRGAGGEATGGGAGGEANEFELSEMKRFLDKSLRKGSSESLALPGLPKKSQKELLEEMQKGTGEGSVLEKMVDNPFILGSFDQFITVNEILTLECVGGMFPTFWKVVRDGHIVDIKKGSQTSIDIADVQEKYYNQERSNSDNSTLMTNRLVIEQVQINDAGAYLCYLNNSLVSTAGQHVAATYVYVKDPENFFHPAAKEYTVLQGDYFILPCRPTDPDLYFQLLKNDQIVNGYEFDPKSGFIFPIVTDFFNGFFQCRAISEEKCEILKIKLNYKATNKKFNMVVSIKHSNDIASNAFFAYVSIGDVVKTTCTINSFVNESFILKMATLGLTSAKISGVRKLKKYRDYYRVQTTSNMPKYFSQELEGLQECWNEGFGGGQYFFALTYTSGLPLVVRALSKMVVAYLSDSKGEISWMTMNRDPLEAKIRFFKNGQPFKKNAKDKRVKFVYEGATSYIPVFSRIIIEHPIFMDQGIYTLIIWNDNMKAREDIEFLVYENLQLTLTYLAGFEDGLFIYPGHNYSLRCSVTGYPIPLVVWTFAKCQEYPCHIDLPETGRTLDSNVWKQVLDVDSVDASIDNRAWQTGKQIIVETQREVVTTLYFQGKHSGQFGCYAINKAGREIVDTKTVFVSELYEGFGLLDEGNADDLLPGSSFNITCLAQRYAYDGPTLYEVNEESGVEVPLGIGNITVSEIVKYVTEHMSVVTVYLNNLQPNYKEIRCSAHRYDANISSDNSTFFVQGALVHFEEQSNTGLIIGMVFMALFLVAMVTGTVVAFSYYLFKVAVPKLAPKFKNRSKKAPSPRKARFNFLKGRAKKGLNK